MSIKSGYFDFLYLIDFYLMLQIHMIHQSSLLILLINESCNLIGWKQSKSKENVSKEAFYLVRKPPVLYCWIFGTQYLGTSTELTYIWGCLIKPEQTHLNQIQFINCVFI